MESLREQPAPLGRSPSLGLRLEHRSLAGQEFFNIRPEYLLPLICLHSAYHAWDGLSSICDVAGLAAVEGLDWEKVMAVAAVLSNLRRADDEII